MDGTSIFLFKGSNKVVSHVSVPVQHTAGAGAGAGVDGVLPKIWGLMEALTAGLTPSGRKLDSFWPILLKKSVCPNCLNIDW